MADSGPGIAPFFTTKRHSGGIGLTLVSQIAAAHRAGVERRQTSGGRHDEAVVLRPKAAHGCESAMRGPLMWGAS